MGFKLKVSCNKFMVVLFTVFICSYTGIFASYNGSILYSSFLLLILFFLFLINKIKFNRIPYVWCFLFAFLVLNSFLNLPHSFFYIILFILGLMILSISMEFEDINLMIKLLKYVSVILSISIIWQAFFPSSFYTFSSQWFYYSNQYEQVLTMGSISHKYSGLFYEVSFSAFTLSIGYAIVLIQVYLYRKNKLRNLIILCLIYFSVILTGKRSFILMLPTLSLLFFMLVYGREMKKGALLSICLLLIIFMLNINTIIELVDSILTKGTMNNIDLSTRDKYWKLAIEMFNSSPLIGAGVNKFDILFNNSGIKSISLEFAGAHNSYIQFLAELGIIGTFCYIVSILDVLIKGTRNIFYNYKNENLRIYYFNLVSLFVVITSLIYALSGNPFYQPQQLISFFIFVKVIYFCSNRRRYS